jgi:phage gpG-like protein
LIIGSNLIYAAIHQWGGKTKAHEIRARHAKALRFNGRFFKSVKHPGSEIPARPFLGVPDGFEDTFFSDPKIREVLGIAVGGDE